MLCQTTIPDGQAVPAPNIDDCTAIRGTLLPDGIDSILALLSQRKADARKPSPMGEGGFERNLTFVKFLSKTDEALRLEIAPSIPLQNAE